MSDARPSWEERVWAWMRRENRPVSVAEVRQKFFCSRSKATHCLWRLVERKGAAVRVGSGRGCRYLATKWCPYDTRGLHPNTYAALRRHSFPAFDGVWSTSRLNPVNNGGSQDAVERELARLRGIARASGRVM